MREREGLSTLSVSDVLNIFYFFKNPNYLKLHTCSIYLVHKETSERKLTQTDSGLG